MKTLFVFFSFEGNCRELVRIMSDETGGESVELIPQKHYPRHFFGKYASGGRAALLRDEPALLPFPTDFHETDLVVVGGPVWAFTMSPPIRTFLGAVDWSGVRVGCFVMHRGGPGMALRNMASLVKKRGGTVAGRAAFTDLRRGDPDATRKAALHWVRQVTQNLGG